MVYVYGVYQIYTYIPTDIKENFYIYYIIMLNCN